MPEPQNSGGEVSETEVRASAPDDESPTRTDASSPDGTPPDWPAENPAAAASETTPPTTAPDPPVEDVTSTDAAAPDDSAQPGDAEKSDAAQESEEEADVADSGDAVPPDASVAEPAVTATKRVAGDLGADDGDQAREAGRSVSASSQVSGTVEVEQSSAPAVRRTTPIVAAASSPGAAGTATKRVAGSLDDEPAETAPAADEVDDPSPGAEDADEHSTDAGASGDPVEEAAEPEADAAVESAGDTESAAKASGSEAEVAAEAGAEEEAAAADAGTEPAPETAGSPGAEAQVDTVDGAGEDAQTEAVDGEDARAEAVSGPDPEPDTGAESEAEADPAETGAGAAEAQPVGGADTEPADEVAVEATTDESAADATAQPETTAGTESDTTTEPAAAEDIAAEQAAEVAGGATAAEEVVAEQSAEGAQPATAAEEVAAEQGSAGSATAPGGVAEGQSAEGARPVAAGDVAAETVSVDSATAAEDSAEGQSAEDARSATAAGEVAAEQVVAGSATVAGDVAAEPVADVAPAAGRVPERDDRPTDEQERVVVEPPPSAAEQTQQFAPIRDAVPPPSAAEQTQQIPRIAAAPQAGPAKAPEESEVEKTTRIELKDLAGLRADPAPGPAPQQVRAAPPVEPAEQTQQFARPNFDGPPPRAASAADFAGLTAPHVKPARRPPQAPAGLAPPVPTASPADFAGLAPPRATPQRIPPQPAAPQDFAGLAAPHPAAPRDFAGLAAPQPASPADFAGLTAPRAQPQRIAPDFAPTPPAPETEDRPKTEAPRRRRTLIAVAAVVVLLLGVGIAFGPKLVEALQQAQIAAPPEPVQLNPTIKPLNQNAPLPTQAGLNAALSGPLGNPGLGTFAGAVLDARTGQVLWQQNAGQTLVPASTGKLLAMSAALLVLDHDQRLTTKVVRGSQPGSVVLVGGGDLTLSTLPTGEESVYPGAARFDDLVAQVRAAAGGNVTSVLVDTSRYTGPGLAPGWLPQDVAGGMMAPMEPVMLDGGRADPTVDYSPRTSTPALQAAQRLATGLGATQVSNGAAPPNAQVLGQVESPTVREMVDIAMQHSDNMLAEALAREVAIATGNEPSFAGSAKAVRDVLARHGFDVTGTTMADGSGLSLEDRTTPKLLAALLGSATAPAGPDGGLAPQSAQLRALLPGLPVAGGNGSLSDRYGGSDGRGWVRAKTGTLDGVNSLAGTVVTEGGRMLVFALMSNGTSPAVARPALDEVANALRACGCR
ncbi:D-alanyl-D-alanine carboxypeptidase/D-alanyl-D-alanine endopeptidase [Saccharopolyspora sp. 5N708]|uniref:D-alanyl-D-alanine carboxypeptidase/D-alanyl-D-alanine endopeptidase n=1 Tax=Saccharopolyspora sp. 5N708 TaxID=3457424 RepID=UPI003FD51206